MMTIRVGFDFDDVVYPWYDTAHEWCVRSGLAQRHPMPTGWAPHETYGCTLDEWYEELDRATLDGFLHGQDPLPDTVEWIRLLYKKGFQIHFITARGYFTHGEQIKRETKDFLIKHDIPYDTLSFTKQKGEKAVELGLNYFIDDNLDHYNNVASTGIETYLLDRPWNVNDRIVNEFRRVKSVKQYVDLILTKHWYQTNILTPRQKILLEEETPR